MDLAHIVGKHLFTAVLGGVVGAHLSWSDPVP